MLVWVVGIGMLVVCGIAAVREERARRKRLDRLFEGREALSAEEFGKRYFSGAEAAIAARLRDILAEQLGIDCSRVTPDDDLMDELSIAHPLDSMDVVELVMSIESTFEVQISDRDAAKLRTIRDVVHYLSARGVATERDPST